MSIMSLFGNREQKRQDERKKEQRIGFMKNLRGLVVDDNSQGNITTSEEHVSETEHRVVGTIPAEEIAPHRECVEETDGIAPEVSIDEEVEIDCTDCESEEIPEMSAENPGDETQYPEDENTENNGSGKKKRGLAAKLKAFGHSLKREEETVPPLVLIRDRVAEMEQDIQEALVEGSTVMVDFAAMPNTEAAELVTRLVNYVRLHDGVFYVVTESTLVISLKKDSVIEWRLEPAGEE